MALYINNKNITGIYEGTKAISRIYQGTKLIYEAIRSCFGKGFWINEKEWSNTDAWKN